MLYATLGLILLFGVAFVAARQLANYGVVDVVWSYAFILIAALYAAGSPGWPARRLALLAVAAVWAGRLGTHLLRRVARLHPEEDARYSRLRQTWARGWPWKMFAFFQAQALSVALLAVGFLAIASNPSAEFSALEFAGAGLCLLGVAGEALADRQLARFRADPARRAQVCAVGLWRWSRHPNYFSEWLVWVGFGGWALAAPHGYVGLAGPIGMLWLLLKVTGVPIAEAQSLASKGDAYRAYQRVTNAFFPGPRRRSGPAA